MASSAIFNFCLKSADLAARLHASCAHDLPEGERKIWLLFHRKFINRLLEHCVRTQERKKKKLRHHHVIFHGLDSYRSWFSTNERASCIHCIGESEGKKFCYPVDGELSSHTVIQRLNNWALVAKNMMSFTGFACGRRSKPSVYGLD